MTTTTWTISRRSYSPEPLHHRHDFAQIVLPETGCLEMTVAETTGVVAGTDLVVVPATQHHICWSPAPTTCLVIDLPTNHGFDRTAATFAVPFRPIDARLQSIIRTLQTEIATGGAGDHLIAEALGAYTVAALAATTIAPEPRPTTPASQRAIARDARVFIADHLTEPLSVDQIAAAVGTSAAHLQRAFKATFDETIVAAIHRQRLERARNLLRHTDASVTEIALAVGFNDPSYFARLFRRHLGISPARFRASI